MKGLNPKDILFTKTQLPNYVAAYLLRDDFDYDLIQVFGTANEAGVRLLLRAAEEILQAGEIDGCLLLGTDSMHELVEVLEREAGQEAGL